MPYWRLLGNPGAYPMIMLCWFYCISFAKFFYFAIAPLLFVLSLFMLRRGISMARISLRQRAFLLMFVALVKACLFDIRMLKKEMLCAVDPRVEQIACNSDGLIAVDILGLVLLLLGSFILLHYYRLYLHVEHKTKLRPEDMNLKFWANLAWWGVIAMAAWQAAPWVGYLTIGRIPAIFMQVPWQSLALLNFILLLTGYWKIEGCAWEHVRDKKLRRVQHADQTWNARDTIVMATLVYIVVLMLSYAAHDVLTKGLTG